MTTPTPEDRLAALLREEGDTIVPSGDGLQKIQQRVAVRRRTRWVLPGAVVATAAAATLFFALAGPDGRTALKQVPQSSGEPTATASAEPSPSATPTVAGGGLDHAFENPALWPFTSAQEIAAWQTTYPYAGDKVALVQHYLKDVLSLDGTFTLTKPCESCDVVDIRLGGSKVGQAALERFELDGERVYTISTIGETDLTLTAPTVGEAISSPTRVTGRLTGVDENVRITLTDSQGGQLGTANAPAGSGAPWEGSVSWSATGWVHGAVVLTTFSAKDGTLTRLTAVPVMRGQSGGPGAFQPAIWPFASAAQVSAWQQDRSAAPWADAPLEVARHFATDYLRLGSGVFPQMTCASCATADLHAPDGHAVATVHLAREPGGAWSVTGVQDAGGLTVTSPDAGQRFTNGSSATGTVQGVDESISLALLNQSGRVLTTATTPAGADQPWTAALRWTDEAWYTGAVVVKTFSAKDGSLSHLDVRRVVRA